MKRTLPISISIVVVATLAYSYPSIFSVYLWSRFPEENLKVFDSANKASNNKECRGFISGKHKPTAQEIEQCFSQASVDRVIIDKETRPYSQSVSSVYRCDMEKFSGEIVYFNYATSEKYVCTYKISDTWNNIDHYALGDLAGFPPEGDWLSDFIIMTLWRE